MRAHSVFILASAKDDYRGIRKYVVQKFGIKVWQDSDIQYKELLKNIGEFPFAGLVPDEAILLGVKGICERLLGQTRIIYEIAHQRIYMYMFVSTRRDFMTMLTDRLLKA